MKVQNLEFNTSDVGLRRYATGVEKESRKFQDLSSLLRLPP
jgi:hypothetical protein